jgi:DNA-nicking Smr family endonuclease
MNFGDILDEWDRRSASRARQSREYAPAEALEESPVPPNPLALWLGTRGVFDKDAALGEEISAAERRRRLLRKRPDGTVDLHGLTKDEAWITLEGFFRSARQRGFEKLLIVHGKGNHSGGDAVLREISRQFIERCPFAGESGAADSRQGGSGATWVLLKNPEQGKHPEPFEKDADC